MEIEKVEKLMESLECKIHEISFLCNEFLNVEEEFIKEKDAVAALITLKNIISFEIEFFLAISTNPTNDKICIKEQALKQEIEALEK